MTDFNPTSEQSKIINPDQWTSAVIEARAGSGKTSTIIRRAMNQVDSFVEQESWKHIAIISFTNKSAEDIKKKVKQLNGNNILAMTFHSFLLHHVLSFSELFRNKENLFYDYGQQVSSLTDWANHIKKHNKIPFADNIKEDYVFREALIVLKKYPYIKKYLKSKFTAIYIDEAQDNNSLQYYIVSEFLKLDIQIVMVGDPNQTIYSFRGADANKFIKLKKDKNYPKHYLLTHNFRCHENINTCANNYVVPSQNNIDAAGFGVFVQHASEFNKTYSNIDEGLSFLFRAIKGDKNIVNSNIIRKLNLPLISQPKILASSSSPFHLNQLFSMYFGGYREELEFIDNVIPHVKHRITRKVFCDLKDNPNKDNLNALNELVGEFSQEEYEEIIETFMSEEAKQFYKLDDTKNFAMTIHSAKGLEFRNVVLMCHDFQSIQTDDEKNIFYVACTRAKKRLFFVNCDI